MELLTAVLAHEAKISEVGTVDLLGLFEDVYTDEMPLTLPHFCVFLDMEFVPADLGQSHIIGFRLLDGGGRPVCPPVGVQIDAPRHDPKPRKVMHHTQNFHDTVFRSAGTHHLDVVYRGQTLRRLHLNILMTA